MEKTLAHPSPWRGGYAALGAGLGLVGALVALEAFGMLRPPETPPAEPEEAIRARLAIQGVTALALVAGGAAAFAPPGHRTGAAIGGALGLFIVKAAEEKLATPERPLDTLFGLGTLGAPMLGAWVGAHIQTRA